MADAQVPYSWVGRQVVASILQGTTYILELPRGGVLGNRVADNKSSTVIASARVLSKVVKKGRKVTLLARLPRI